MENDGEHISMYRYMDSTEQGKGKENRMKGNTRSEMKHEREKRLKSIGYTVRLLLN